MMKTKDHKPLIAIVAALDEQNAIGRDGDCFVIFRTT